MKKLVFAGLLIIGIVVTGFSTGTLTGSSKFASVEKAKELLTQPDAFTGSWSRFDIESRMQDQHATREELFNFIAAQARNWSSEEKKRIQVVLQQIEDQILQKDYRIRFPEEIYFVKTTAAEEGGAAGYTRANYIVLKEDLGALPAEELKHIIVHELFHIVSRANPGFRREMYELIGFKLMKPVNYPEALQPYRITNPDAPQTDSYISLTAEGKPAECMMILYSERDYSGGAFFNYLNVGFLSLNGKGNKTIEYAGNDPVIYPFNKVDGFFEQVGKNTQYVIHPEEILADNFAFVILDKKELPSQDIVERIKKKLKE